MAAGSLGWLRAALGGLPYEVLLGEAAECPPGCEGLLFQPTSRASARLTPIPTRGAPSSASRFANGRGALVRATFEGVA